MLISTRGRYALRVMCDLLEHSAGGYVPLKEIAARQNISLKYLESIMKILVRDGLVEASSGRGGGYRLCRSGEEYRVGEILRCTEGSLAPVACVEAGAALCDRQEDCVTYSLWEGLRDAIDSYLDGITLKELMVTSKNSSAAEQRPFSASASV